MSNMETVNPAELNTLREDYLRKVSEIVTNLQLKSVYRSIANGYNAQETRRFCENCLLHGDETIFKHRVKTRKRRKRPKTTRFQMLVTCQTCSHVATVRIPRRKPKPTLSDEIIVIPDDTPIAIPSKKRKRKAKTSEFCGLNVNVVENVQSELKNEVLCVDITKPTRKRRKLERTNSIIEINDSSEHLSDECETRVVKMVPKKQGKTVKKAKQELRSTENLQMTAKQLQNMQKTAIGTLQTKKQKKQLKHKLKTTQNHLKNIDSQRNALMKSLQTFLSSL